MNIVELEPDLNRTILKLSKMTPNEIEFIAFCLDRLHKGLSGDQVWLEYLDSNSGSV